MGLMRDACGGAALLLTQMTQMTQMHVGMP